MSSSADLLDSLPAFAAWNQGKPDQDRITIFDFLCFNATPELFFAFASLLRPELILVEDSYFIKERFGEAAYKAWKEKLSEPRDIQHVMNHVHLTSVFQNQDVADDVALVIARTIELTWNQLFAELKLKAVVDGSEFGDLSISLVSSGSDSTRGTVVKA
jgi:hypothetical protein